LSAEANPRTSSHNEETVMQVMRTIAQDCCVTIGVNSQQSQNSSKLIKTHQNSSKLIKTHPFSSSCSHNIPFD
jgi:hypothetical protein